MTQVEIRVDRLEQVEDEFADAVARLLPQLSGAPIPSRKWLEDVVRAEANAVFVARDEDGRIVGMTTLVTFPLATGIRAWIHDVVVDEAVRGRGVGRALTDAALKEAEQRGAWTVDLTTRPWREDANRLYERAGFEPRETRVYRFGLPANPMPRAKPTT
jgi:ribosomal protein S18 acetylase RimI-like enzyme